MDGASVGRGASATALLARHRPMLLDAIRAALAGPSALAGLVRRHVGVEGEDGRPADAAGKLLRPSLVVITATELGARVATAVSAAVALELVHNFSLVHDDIQDRDRVRRGRPTLWTLCGEAEAINAGDLLHAMAFREAARCGPEVVAVLSEATIEMVEGQSLDLSYEVCFVDQAPYRTMIDRKTGALLGCAFELGGVVAGAPMPVRAELQLLGRALGRAFQVRDDALGIWGDAATLGKPKGSDVRRRKKGFPAVWARERAGGDDRARLDAIYASDPVSGADAAWVVRLLEELGAREAADAAVAEHTAEALGAVADLPFSPRGRADLRDLVSSLAGRTR